MKGEQTAAMYTGLAEAGALHLHPDGGVEWSEDGYKIHKSQSLTVWTVITAGLKGHAAVSMRRTLGFFSPW